MLDPLQRSYSFDSGIVLYKRAFPAGGAGSAVALFGRR